jgi:O-antigen ligase
VKLLTADQRDRMLTKQRGVRSSAWGILGTIAALAFLVSLPLRWTQYRYDTTSSLSCPGSACGVTTGKIHSFIPPTLFVDVILVLLLAVALAALLRRSPMYRIAGIVAVTLLLLASVLSDDRGGPQTTAPVPTHGALATVQGVTLGGVLANCAAVVLTALLARRLWLDWRQTKSLQTGLPATPTE